MDDPDEWFVDYKKIDPASWDEEGFDRPWNKDSIDKIVRGHWQKPKRYEHASYLSDAGKKGFVNPEEFLARSEKFLKDVKDFIKRRAFNSESQSELQRGSWNAFEREYLSRFKGEKEEMKINLVATSLINCCLDEERRETKGFIDDPEFLLWLFERNLVSRRGIATKFVDLIESKTRGKWEYGEDETRRLEEMAEKLCSWNPLLSRRAAVVAAAPKTYRPDEEEEGKVAASELLTCIEREDEDEESEEGEENDTIRLLSSVSRHFALIRLLDNEQFDRSHDLGEMMERMAEIDWPENQLPLLLEWALRHRSAMGCTLAARIIARWSLPSTRSDLLLFIVNARPPAIESEGRTRSGVGKGGRIVESKEETGEERFLRALTRLFVALSHEELLTYEDLHELYTSNKEYFDGRANQGYSLPALLAGLPLLGEVTEKEDGESTRKAEYWKRIVSLLNGMSCRSAQSWHDPMSAEQEAAAKEIVEKVRSLSHREAHELAARAGNALLDEWREAKGEESHISLPSRSALLLVCQLMDATVDSSLLPRFLLDCLPYLLAVSRLTPQLAVYASTAALFLTARCFQSHLSLHAMGVWRIVRMRMAQLVHTLCPAHWQTRQLVELFGLELPEGCCPMQHACDVSRGPIVVEKEATAMLRAQLEKEEKWDERRLSTVADLAGDVSAQVGTLSLRDWWRGRLVDEITSGPEHARKPMLRLLALSVYRGVIDAVEEVERAREGLRREDPSIVSASLAILDTLLVGASNRREEELFVEGMIGGEAVAGVIDECLRMMGKPCSSAFECSSIQNRLMKRQFGKRAMRAEMEEIARREDSAGRAELYRQIARKCSGNGWSGLELEEGGRGLAAVTIFEADAARREMRWILVKEQNEKTSPTRDRLAASMWDAMRGEQSSSCLQYVLLRELRKEMIEEDEAPPHCAPAYRAFAASMISGFIGLMKEPKRLPSSSLLLPIVLFVWRDADEESRGRVKKEIRGFLRGWRGGETTHLLLIARLAVSLSFGMRGKEGKEWVTPFYGLIRQRVIGPERNGELFEQVQEMMERIESEDGMEETEEGEGDGRKEVDEGMNLDGWSTGEDLRFPKPVQEFVKAQKYELVDPRQRKRRGLRISACRMFASDEWLDVRAKALEGWRRINQAHSLSPRGRLFSIASKRRKLM